MSIRQKFDQLKQKNETALIAYAMAGYPDLTGSMRLVQDLCDSGADMVEIGFPFSDPIADGSTLQYAATEALRRGITLQDVFESTRKIRTDKPLILMSYLNPLLAIGADTLFSEMKNACFSGLIIPDLPAEESEPWSLSASGKGIDLILLVTPVSGPERIKQIALKSRGFLYCVSVTGTTGARSELPSNLPGFLASVRQAADSQNSKVLPIAVGFGISKPDQIRLLRNQADGVIVASRIIDAVRKGEDVGVLVSELKEATKMINRKGREERKEKITRLMLSKNKRK